MKTHRGFTLIETLFAVLLFTTSLVALMSISGRGIASTAIAREELTARMLALEGIEAARNIRDRNFGLNQAWDTGLTNPDCSSGCDLEYGSSFGEPTLIQSSGPLYRNLFTGQYSQNPGDELTPYIRTITVTPGSTNPDEIDVVSRVEWDSRGRTRQVEYQTFFMRWRAPSSL